MEITYTKKLVKEVNKWLKKNGFTTRCVFDKETDLSYSPDEDLIYVPESYNGEPDSLFMRCLRNFGLTSDFDTITLSFLHELGHAQTLHLLTTKESKNCDVLKATYAIAIDEDDDDFYLKYWEVTDEVMANKWAVMYADCFEKKVQKLEEIIGENVKFG